MADYTKEFNVKNGLAVNGTVVVNSAGVVQSSAIPSAINSHLTNTSNPHSVTATQVGLGNVTNESKATMFTSPTFTGTAVFSTTGAMTLPVGTTAERPGTPVAGQTRYNSELMTNETFNGTTWATASGQMLGNALVKAIAYNAQTIAENITIPANYNAMSVGKITIADGYKVTVEDNGRWVIL